MPVGKSGRIVIDLDPAKKAEIYGALDKRGTSLRAWFLARVADDLLPDPTGTGQQEPRKGRKRT